MKLFIVGLSVGRQVMTLVDSDRLAEMLQCLSLSVKDELNVKCRYNVGM